MIFVSDTSPLTYLIEVEELSLLQKLFSEVVIPNEVFKELEAAAVNIAAISTAISKGWVSVRTPKTHVPKNMEEGLDPGEAEAIVRKNHPVWISYLPKFLQTNSITNR